MQNVKQQTSTLGSLALAIKALASALISLFTTLGRGAKMLDAELVNLEEQRCVTLSLGRKHFATEAVNQFAEHHARAKQQREATFAQDPSGQLRKDYEETLAEVGPYVDAELEKLRASYRE